MSRIYDNWERLVGAVRKREEIWQLCHQQSRSPSVRSESSDLSSSSRTRPVRGDQISADAVPGFGDRYQNDPQSAEDYTGIFNRVREEMNTGTSRDNDTRKDPYSWGGKAQQMNNSNYPDEKKQVWTRIFGFGR